MYELRQLTITDLHLRDCKMALCRFDIYASDNPSNEILANPADSNTKLSKIDV